jgi:polysaccharide biosynthesis transport protein
VDAAVEQEKPEMGLRDLLEIVRRRSKLLLLALAGALAVTLALALLLPATYQSAATILIEQQEVPPELVRSTVTSYADQRLQVINQRVMTTQNLLEIIRRYDLYPKMMRRESRERIIEEMRDDIRFNMLSADVIDPRSGVPRKATIAFTVGYEHRSPDLAMKVANDLTTLYLNENLTSRTRLAQDTSNFLTTEGDRLQKEIATLEQKLGAFKARNVEQLPELAGLNLQLLDRTEQELRNAETEMRSLAQQRTFLDAQLAQVKPNSVIISETGERILSPADRLKLLKSELASRKALYSPGHPDIVRIEREVAGLEGRGTSRAATADVNDVQRQLDEARGELAAAREKYSAEHPDVKRLERSVTQLESEFAQAVASPVPPALSDGADNPAYIQLRAQLEATVNNMRALEGKIASLRAQTFSYQRKVSISPRIEQEYREITRDYDNAQLRYRELRAKQMEAELAENLESGRKGERFTMIEPPLPPEEPASPNRLAILIIGLLLSLGLAGGSAAVAEATDTSVRSRRDLVDVMRAAPLALIPKIITSEEIAASKLRMKRAIFGSCAAAVLAVTLAHFFYRPLDTLWFVLMRRLGI